jgi:hypothetical protein
MAGCNKMNENEIKQMLENDPRNIIGNSLGTVPPQSGVEHMLPTTKEIQSDYPKAN